MGRMVDNVNTCSRPSELKITDLTTGGEKPITQNGYITVPEGPGLGIELNESAVKEHLDPENLGYFEPTPEWDTEYSWDRLWS